jgi:hypothetical protein
MAVDIVANDDIQRETTHLRLGIVTSDTIPVNNSATI